MRTEEEMINLILSVAQEEDRIKVVGLEGSRTDKNARKDEFQDYDITYVVTEIKPFIQNEEWLNVFGKIIFMQKPEAMSLYAPELGNWFSYLMLFEDGNRIDLTIVPLAELDLYLASDHLLEILLDKDELVTVYPIPSDINYHVEKPTPQEFDDCCNEFWWIATYVAKGICRKEFIYAAEYLNQIMRKELLRMIAWKIGFETDFSVTVGKNYKYLEQHVSQGFWERFISTYEMASYKELWEVLFTLQALFREASKDVAKRLKTPYPKYDENISNYVNELYRNYH